MNVQMAKKILEAAEKLEGTVIKTDNASSNMSFVSKARMVISLHDI